MLCFAASAPVSVSRLSRTNTVHRRPFAPIMSSSAPSAERPAQVVLSPLPKIFVYDHCPFATRSRYALGVKNVKHSVVWLLNDDVETGTNLVGKKIVPIFQPRGADGPAVTESMDIALAVDSDPRYGPVDHFRPASSRSDIGDWFQSNAELIRRLTRPRLVNAPLPEFAFRDARETYIRNHALPAPEDYDVNLGKSAEYLAQLQPQIQALDDMIYCPAFCTEGGISFDDVDLYPRLRTLTVLKDLALPAKTLEYIKHHSDISEVAEYSVFAT